MVSATSVMAGVASTDITPGLGVELGGYPYFDRANTGVHDPLVGAALYLNDSAGGEALIIATDLFWITRGQADEIREGIVRRSGLRAERIFITCSHTHSAPWMSSIFEAFPGQPEFITHVSDEYLALVRERLVAVGLSAMAEPFPAQLAHSVVTCGDESGVGGNRRHPDGGAVDADVPVLTVSDGEGVVRAIWTKYALHPTVLHGDNTLVSADFPGPMRAVVSDHFPGALFMYSMGTAGDQSPRYYRQGQTFDEAARFGAILGQAVVDAVGRAVPIERPRVATAMRAVELVTKTYASVEELAAVVEQRRAHEAALVEAGAPYTERQSANLWLLGAECDYHNAIQETDGRLAERYARCTPIEVGALAIGDIAWAFLPGEIFCDFGLAIKQASPYATTHVITLTNGDLPGYCVTAESLIEGGYEPGNSILDSPSGSILVATALQLLTQLHQER